jgi:apolipoprotein N-acyltransferase
MSRVRAVEHGRAVVVAATSGVSAIIAPDGAVMQESELFTPAALVAQVPLRSGITLATRLGPLVEALICLLAGGAVVTAIALRRTRRSAGRSRQEGHS